MINFDSGTASYSLFILATQPQTVDDSIIIHHFVK